MALLILWHDWRVVEIKEEVMQSQHTHKFWSSLAVGGATAALARRRRWMLGAMSRRTRAFWGGWSVPTCLTWLICVLVDAWLAMRQAEVGTTLGTNTFVLFLVASVLGLALGVVLVRERRSEWILVAVPTVALLATGTMVLAYYSFPVSIRAGDEGPYWDWAFFFLLVILGAPVIVGAFVGAVWRRLVGRTGTGEETSPGPEQGR